MDAIAAGNRDPWQRYLHDAVVITGEDGRTWRKGELLQRNADGTTSGFVERRESWDITWRRLPAAD